MVVHTIRALLLAAFFCAQVLNFNLKAQSVPFPDTIDWTTAWTEYVPPERANLFDVFEASRSQFAALNNSPANAPSYAQKRFERASAMFLPRLGTEPGNLGSIDVYHHVLKNYLSNYSCPANDPSDWSFVGPTDAQTLTHRMGHISAVHMFEDDHNIILIGSATSGIWRSQDHGLSWQIVTDALTTPTLGVTNFAVSPSNPNIVFASTGMTAAYLDPMGFGLLKSVDKGLTWSIVSLPVNTVLPRVNDVVFDPNNPLTIYALTDKQILVSSNGGSTWADFVIPADLGIHNHLYEIAVLPVTGKIFLTATQMYANTSQLWVYNTTTSGWDNIISTLDFSPSTAGQSIKFSDPDNLNFAISYSTWDGDRKTIITHDGGITFGAPNLWAAGGAGNISKFEVQTSRVNPMNYYVGGLWIHDGVDGGALSLNSPYNAASPNISHIDVRSMQVLQGTAGQDIILVGNDGGLTVSEDGGVTWQSWNKNIENSQVFGIGISNQENPKLVYGLMDNNTWEDVAGTLVLKLPGDGEEIGMLANGNYIMYQPYGSDISTNNNPYFPGRIALNALILPGEFYLGGPVKVDDVNKRVYIGLDKDGGTPEAKVAVYDDVTPLKTGLGTGTSRVETIGVCESDPNYLIVANGNVGSSSNILYKSTDGGQTFTNISLATLHNSDFSVVPFHAAMQWKAIRNIQVCPTDPNKMWICVDGVFTEGGLAKHEKHRVLKTTDGGIHWYDYSENLPGLPGMTMTYYKGSNDMLFLGTDIGIYYRDANMSQWECFSENLPRVPITDLEINYCENVLYASTFGRGVWKSPIPFDNNIKEFVISANTTWDHDVNMAYNIRVRTGRTLTITGTLNMVNGKKIIVEKDAKLVVNGGTITSKCDDFWSGIEVWGTANASQLTSAHAQGEVMFSNGALIEHAFVAVALWKPSDWSTTGGIIRAINSTFRNNKKDVEFLKYSNDDGATHFDNKSFFTNVEFTWTDELRAAIPLAHVTLYQVDGVKFSGCTFGDYRDPATTILDDNNVGIKSIDAKYRVSGRCTILGGCTGSIDDPSSGWDPTIFENLYFGINASNVTTMNTINVDRCIFRDNGYGVHLQSVPSPLIVRNKIKFTPTPHFFGGSAMHGIHAVNSKNLTIEENIFVDEAPGTRATYGVVCSDLGETEEQIYKNSFTGVFYANYTQGKNRKVPNGAVGLQFPCNTNTDNWFDHRITGLLWGLPDPVPPSDYGVKATSGSSVKPVGTSFTNDVAGVKIMEDYRNTSVWPITYWYHPTQDPDDENITDMPASGPIDCQSHLTSYPGTVGKLLPQHKTAYRASFLTTSNEIAVKESELENKTLDANETASVMNAINNLAPNNKQSVRSMLNSYSPYLTTEVLFAVADNPPSHYSHSWLRELLIANIEAVTPELLTFLETKQHPLPSSMIRAVADAVGTTYTQKAVLESEIGQLYADRAFYANSLLMDILHDTTFVNTDSLRYWLQSQNNVLYQQHIIDSYLHDGNFVQAETEINNLEQYALTAPPHLVAEITDFVSLKRWLLPILRNAGEIARLSPGHMLYLRNAAARSTGTAQYQAQNILCFFYNECPDHSIDPETNAGSKIMMPPVAATSSGIEFSVYPNPASDKVAIELPQETFSQFENVEIVVSDLLGKVIHQAPLTKNTYLWESSSMRNGVYLIMIRSGNTQVAAKKVVINH